MFKSFFCKSNILILLFCNGVIFSKPVHAFFESKVKYDLENRWLIMLSDNSSKNRYKAMRAFIVFPEWGLPVLRNSIKTSRFESISWQMGALMGMLGDSSDVPNLLKIWNKLQGKEKSEVFLGSIKRIYRKHRTYNIVKPKLTELTINLLEDELLTGSGEKNFMIRYRIKNSSQTNIFLRINAHFWVTKSNENLSSEYLWFKPGEHLESKIKALFVPSENSNNLRVDFRIWEVGSTEQLIHKTINIPI